MKYATLAQPYVMVRRLPNVHWLSFTTQVPKMPDIHIQFLLTVYKPSHTAMHFEKPLLFFSKQG